MSRLRYVAPFAVAAGGLVMLVVAYFGAVGADESGLATFAWDGQEREGSLPITPWDTPGVSTQNQVGTDGRVQVTDTLGRPYRSIAWLGLYYDGSPPRNFSCTAAFIGPDVLITAAHCLYDAERGAVDEITVIPAANDTEEPFGRVTATAWSIPQAFIENVADHRFDYAVISLAGRDPIGETTGWSTLAVLESETLADAEFMPMLAGYPGDRAPRTMWQHSQPAMVEVTENYLGYEVDTASGQSGSPVFSSNGFHRQHRRVVGIHVLGGGGFDANRAVRATTTMAGHITSHCAQWDCEPSIVDEGDPPAPTVARFGTATASGTPVSRVRIPLAAGSGPLATPSTEGGSGQAAARLWQWLAVVEGYREAVNEISETVVHGGSPAAGAGAARAVEGEAATLVTTVEGALRGGGPVCETAHDWIAEAGGRAAAWAGAWATIFEHWPGGEHFAAAQQALAAYTVAVDEARTWVQGCEAARGG